MLKYKVILKKYYNMYFRKLIPKILKFCIYYKINIPSNDSVLQEIPNNLIITKNCKYIKKRKKNLDRVYKSLCFINFVQVNRTKQNKINIKEIKRNH